MAKQCSTISVARCAECGSAVLLLHDQTGEVFAEAHLAPEKFDGFIEKLHRHHAVGQARHHCRSAAIIDAERVTGHPEWSFDYITPEVMH